MLMTKIKETKKQLKQKIITLQSQMPSAYTAAIRNIEAADGNFYMGSGVILTLTDFSGKEIVSPVCITDGLYPKTIEALKGEFLNSLDLTLSLNRV